MGLTSGNFAGPRRARSVDVLTTRESLGPLNMPADMSSLITTQFISFVRERSANEIKTLMDGLAIRERMLVLLAASNGMRQSELFGLKWRDINFAENLIHITRSIVCGVVAPAKPNRRRSRSLSIQS